MHNWLNAKSIHWKQKAKLRWLQDGDCNTKFFHQSAKSRSIFNSIDKVTVDGTLYEEEEDIKAQACLHFTRQATSSSIILDEALFDLIGPSLNEDQNNFLVATPAPLEIREAVFGLKKHSSPGPDGFSGAFYTHCWDIVGQDVIQAVIHFFTSGRLLRASNAYFLTLLPKIQSPASFSDFRPISLLNFTYKIIAKILATRLSGIIPQLISKHQSAFVKGRPIHDRAALAHDLVQKINSKTKGGVACMKLDISKAFDKLSWDFLFSALHFFKFSSVWINLMRELVCSSRGSVLINKSPCGFFSSTCCLRQGCPLSLYLFILAEEILSLQVEKLRIERAITPISPVSSTPCHLFYADDMLFFLKAKKKDLTRLFAVLKAYQDSSGQVFNLQKSHLLLGNCNARRTHMVTELLLIHQSTLPTNYLGVPLFLGSSRHSYFSKLLDTIRTRLAGWKTKLLSFAGRLILVKHVLSSIPLHIALVIPLPSKTCLHIERLMRNFLWGADPSNSRCHFVRWDKICLPKAEGSLGLRRLKDLNEACMLRLGWSAATEASLWADWFSTRYCKGPSIWHPSNPKYGSTIWKKIRALSPTLQSSSRWTVGNGESISLWYDNWIDNVSFSSKYPHIQFSEDDLVSVLISETEWVIPSQLTAFL